MLCYAVDYKWVIVMGGVKFKFNNLISLNTKNGSERKRLGYFILFYFILLWLIR